MPLVKELPGPPDPGDCAAKLLHLPFPLWLDSASAGGQRARYSYLAADPRAVIKAYGGETWVKRATAPGEGWVSVDHDPLAAARRLMAPSRVSPIPGLPPFQGGMAGYLGYESLAAWDPAPPAAQRDRGLPDVVLGLYDWVIAWDHSASRAWIISTGAPSTGPAAEWDAQARLQEVMDLLGARRPTRGTAQGRGRGADPDLQSTFTPEEYRTAVSRVREHILAGDIFQANISQQFSASLPSNPFELYLTLRMRNPAPFAAYMQVGESSILSISPERFLRADPDGWVETCPIKGTRPRGRNETEDRQLAEGLVASEKDRAENVMIVDLLRNDLSRVCRPGSVRVPALCELEQHPTVHHLVSTVVGRLASGQDAVTLFRAAFPGGSITGAPKIRAMEVISGIEPTARSVYCGAIGFFSLTGAMDTNVAIRTAIAEGGRLYFNAGGGITADSDPAAEYQETLDKAQAFIRACTVPARREAAAR
jgi:para-aminobenzoate synthetase component 1